MKKIIPALFVANYISFYRHYIKLSDDELCSISGIDNEQLKSMDVRGTTEGSGVSGDFILVDSELYEKINIIANFELCLAEVHDKYFKDKELSAVIGLLEDDGNNLVMLLKSGVLRLMRKAYYNIRSLTADF